MSVIRCPWRSYSPARARYATCGDVCLPCWTDKILGRHKRNRAALRARAAALPYTERKW